ncbi:hypothetical protein M9435_004945 [Picochlorum sp. BPE23]|nr:hypothetical protein M9435_004945 [Picochlorum sp. BPE23]
MEKKRVIILACCLYYQMTTTALVLLLRQMNLLLIMAAYLVVEEEEEEEEEEAAHRRRRRKRKREDVDWWVRSTSEQQQWIDGLSSPILEGVEYERFFRVTKAQFHEILDVIKDDITKENTSMREPICPKRKLACFMNYLATGETLTSIARIFDVEESSMLSIIRDVSHALIYRLRPTYGRLLKSDAYIIESERRFRERYGWPGVYGVIDGMHVLINHENAHVLCNKQGYASLACLCISDSDLRCPYYRIGDPGSVHETTMWQNSDLYEALQSAECPAPIMMNDFNAEQFPYYLLGDSAFPLSEYIVTGFDNREVASNNAGYNVKHAAIIQDCVERMIGGIKQRWRVLMDTVYLKRLDRVCEVVECCILLHNFLIEKETPLPTAVWEDILNESRGQDELSMHARATYHFDASSSRQKGIRHRQRLVDISSSSTKE